MPNVNWETGNVHKIFPQRGGEGQLKKKKSSSQKRGGDEIV